MLNCKEVTELCSVEMERPLRLREKMALGVHLWMCTGCTNYRQQVKTMREVAQAYAAGRAITTERGHVDPASSDGSA